MREQSAGILMFRRTGARPEVLLVHPGGPFWANKDEGAWSIPKGLYEAGQDPLSAARREFEEETGCSVQGEFIALGSFKQRSGKVITAWAVESDFDVRTFKSNVFSMEWPPKSGQIKDFPEADRIGWFAPDSAIEKIIKGQVPILGKLFVLLEDKK
ncbi:MAG TPA: NUDIX domain-containing protein [Pseudolabrys sp.]|nr:NUDIX domain-containing protein [Pseudolabrys sp.]